MIPRSVSTLAQSVLTKGLAAVSLACTAASYPAAAQIAPGASGFSDAPVQADRSEYWLMMKEMGACVAASKGDQARTFVGSVIDSAAEAAAFDRLFHAQRNPCLGNFVAAGMVRSHVRGVIAEGLFERLPDEAVTARLASNPVEEPNIVTLHDFARCYAAAHPQDAVALLRHTRVATRGEIDAIQAMAPDFGACLPSGREAKLQPTSVRFALAEALYRLATGAPVATIEKAR